MRLGRDTVHRTYAPSAVKGLPSGPQEAQLLVRTYHRGRPSVQAISPPHFRAFAQGAHATERFLEQAARPIHISDAANAASLLGVPEQALERWYCDYAERRTKAPPPGPSGG